MPKKLKPQKRLPLYIVTNKSGQQYMTTDHRTPPGGKVRKTNLFGLTRKYDA